MQSANRRDSVPQEYLKEVIVRFILLSPSLGAGPSEHEDLIPVLSDLLAFTPADRQRVKAAQTKSKGFISSFFS